MAVCLQLLLLVELWFFTVLSMHIPFVKAGHLYVSLDTVSSELQTVWAEVWHIVGLFIVEEMLPGWSLFRCSICFVEVHIVDVNVYRQ